MKKIVKKIIQGSALVVWALVLLACVFDIQYSILIGPFLDVLLLLGLTIFGLVLTIIFFAKSEPKKWRAYTPFAVLVVVLVFFWINSEVNLGHRLHFLMNRENLEAIDSLSKKSQVYKMTDMLRFQKRLNDASLSNEQKYTSQKQLEDAFGNYIRKENLEPQKLSELRGRLQNSNIVSILRAEDYLILTVDGFVDNEYGYIKTNRIDLKVGNTLPPYSFTVVRLIDFGNGWFFFYTT